MTATHEHRCLSLPPLPLELLFEAVGPLLHKEVQSAQSSGRKTI